MSDISAILRAGKHRIETIGWGQGTAQVIYAKSNKCCALTAISHQNAGTIEDMDLQVAAIRTFQHVNGLMSVADVANWNDAPERTKEDVLAAYDKAIAAAEAQEKPNV